MALGGSLGGPGFHLGGVTWGGGVSQLNRGVVQGNLGRFWGGGFGAAGGWGCILGRGNPQDSGDPPPSLPPSPQRGVNPSSVGGAPLGRGGRATLRPGLTLCLVNGLYPYELHPREGPRPPKRPASPSPPPSPTPPPPPATMGGSPPKSPPRDAWTRHGSLLVFTPPGLRPSAQVRPRVGATFSGFGAFLFMGGRSLLSCPPPPPILGGVP